MQACLTGEQMFRGAVSKEVAASPAVPAAGSDAGTTERTVHTLIWLSVGAVAASSFWLVWANGLL